MFTTLHKTQFIRLTEKKLETLLKKYDLTSVFIVHLRVAVGAWE